MVVMVSVAWHIVGSRKNGACMVLGREYPPARLFARQRHPAPGTNPLISLPVTPGVSPPPLELCPASRAGKKEMVRFIKSVAI